MASKKKDAKKKKKDGGRSSQKELSDEDNGDDGGKSSESKTNFPEEFTKYCNKFHASVIPEILQREVLKEEEEDPKKKPKKIKKDEKTGRSDSIGVTKSEGTTNGGGSTQEETAETTVEELPMTSTIPPPPPPMIFVTYEDGKKNINPTSLSFEVIDMENAILGALAECLRTFNTITSLTIKRCYFSGELLLMLGEILRTSENLTELIIDGCPHPQYQFHALIRDGRSLEYLTLRGCRIDDDQADMIASELSFKEDFKESNTLFYLNLSINLIGDQGARSLAKALRTNRTLVALTLTCNLITDIGAIALANVLKDFPLVEEEVLDRRNHIYHKYKIYMEMREELLEEMGVKQCPGSEGSADREKAGLKKAAVNKKKRKQKAFLTKEMQIKLWKQVDDVPGINHPFVQEVFPSNKKLWCSGNLRLCHLNLSYNMITVLSIEKYFQVITYQTQLKSISSLIQQYGYTGLTDLILQGNLFPIDCAEMSQVQSYLSEMNPTGSDHSLLGETGSSLDKQKKKSKA